MLRTCDAFLGCFVDPGGSVLSMLFLELEKRTFPSGLDVLRRLWTLSRFSGKSVFLTVWISWLEMVYFEDMCMDYCGIGML